MNFLLLFGFGPGSLLLLTENEKEGTVLNDLLYFLCANLPMSNSYKKSRAFQNYPATGMRFGIFEAA
jgi:hypothetical protein